MGAGRKRAAARTSRVNQAVDARRRLPGEDRIAILRAEARYHRERHELYRAKGYGGRATSPVRLRELERARDRAESRLAQAEREARL